MNLAACKKAQRFYDDWESVGEKDRNRIKSEKLIEYINFAKEKIPFYKERLASFNPKEEYPLKDVPVIISDELRELLPPVSEKLIAQKEKCVSVFQSGGTTGSPKTTLFSHEELDMLDLPNARGFYALGLNANDKVANLFAVGGLYMTFIHINRMLQQFGCMNFPFSNHTNHDFIHTMAKLFKINCFAGISSVVMDCLRSFVNMGLDGIKIEKVFYGGEHLYDADRKELQDKLGVELIAAPGYGTVDTWYLGYQCLDCPPGVFHAHDDQVYIEIFNEENGAYCANGEEGMLYATPFTRRLTPIVRYRVGDRAYWLKDQCSCGRTTPLFKLLGRGDDFLRIGYDSVDYNFVQGIAFKIKGASGTIQMEKQREQGKDRLVIRIESDADKSEYDELSEKFNRKLLEERFSLRGFIEKGAVWPVKVEILPIGTMLKNPRTGKLKRIIDVI